jgi:hypothetical protein
LRLCWCFVVLLGFANMAYYPDLGTDASGDDIHIGWLSCRQPFARGAVDPAFVEKLKLLYDRRVRQSRGFHVCPFCEEHRLGLPVELNGKVLTLGSAQIEIKDGKGRTYVAPDLLYHYVTQHEYLPPQEFIDAVCR